MLKLIWVAFWLILILAGLTLAVGLFSSDNVAQKCSRQLSGCLTQTAEHDGWHKWVRVVNCLGINAVCVVKQVKEVF